MNASQVELLELHSLTEFDACVALQTAVWGYADGEVIPRRVFVVARLIGGQVFGAKIDGQVVAFALALPGLRGGKPYLHSHMLAVLSTYRNLGLGRKLKLLQRDEALGRGIRLMEWTFDPMQAKNAYFNLHRLGVVCSRYEENLYGESHSSLQGGLPTDRLVAQWWLGSRRVERVLRGHSPSDKGQERVVVSGTGDRLQAQQKLRTELQEGLARGQQVIAFERDLEGGGTYILGQTRAKERV